MDRPSCLPRSVSEATRERETARYVSSLLDSVVPYETRTPLGAASNPCATNDIILVALAQLAATRTGSSRALISVFSQALQYVLAEATPSTSLAPQPSFGGKGTVELWLSGTAIPRGDGICEHALLQEPPENLVAGLPNDGHASSSLPLFKVDDIAIDPRFADTSCYWALGTPPRFYAGVPIRTDKGINVGVISVYNEQPGANWDEGFTRVLCDISTAAMRYFEDQRSKTSWRRNVRMNRGIGSFIQERATMSGHEAELEPDALDPNNLAPGAGVDRAPADCAPAENSCQHDDVLAEDEHDPLAETEAAGNLAVPPPRSISASTLATALASSEDGRTMTSTGGTHNPSPACSQEQVPQVPTSLSDATSKDTFRDRAAKKIYSRAANLVREALDIEGCLFLDADGHQLDHDGQLHAPTTPDSDTSGDEVQSPARTSSSVPPVARVLGFATSSQSSIEGDRSLARHAAVSTRFLSILLKSYPDGKVFNFEDHGLMLDDLSEDDLDTSPILPRKRRKSSIAVATSKAPDGIRLTSPSTPFEPTDLLQIFPQARSIAFVPIFNTKKDRSSTGGFIYTNDARRSFSVLEELNYIRAFGMLVMTEVNRGDLILDERVKMDVLGSLSHELRSPLHGITLGMELLKDTRLDVTQADITHTIETCTRTLTDTLDHLLDYSKMNHYLSRKQPPAAPRGLRQPSTSVGAGMMSLTSTMELDGLAEEVVESVFAGFCFQQLSVQQLVDLKKQARSYHDRSALNLGLGPPRFRSYPFVNPTTVTMPFSDVTVIFTIDTSLSWTFETQPGAVRRILMNLLGNALQFTTSGTILVALGQKPSTRTSRRRGDSIVTITVSDTGPGIDEDFLRHDLFKPFAQENHLSPGTGLGLKLVKQITKHLGGRLIVRSHKGVGTSVTASLPLARSALGGSTTEWTPESTPADDSAEQPKRDLGDLRGLRVCLLGFEEAGDYTNPANSSGRFIVGQRQSLLASICTNGLGMEVIEDLAVACPDIVVSTEAALPVRGNAADALTQAPCVVVCPNTVSTFQQIMKLGKPDRPGPVEFMSQPIGPRKLGTLLLLAFERWTESQPKSPSASSTGDETIPSIMSALPEPSISTPPTSSPMPDDTDRRAGFPFALTPSEGPSSFSEGRAYPFRPSISRAASTFEDRQHLIVDDNPINVKILSACMRKMDLAHATATNGLEAFDAYKMAPQRCRYIFMDVSMPVMDGFEATRLIRAYERQEKLQPAVVIALTGLASAESQREALASGMDLFLSKPVKLQEIRSILQSHGMESHG